jgi:predicted nucleotidyltransferase
MVLNVYLWGSRVYGTATPESDWDVIVVIKDTDQQPEEGRLQGRDCSIVA